MASSPFPRQRNTKAKHQVQQFSLSTPQILDVEFFQTDPIVLRNSNTSISRFDSVLLWAAEIHTRRCLRALNDFAGAAGRQSHFALFRLACADILFGVDIRARRIINIGVKGEEVSSAHFVGLRDAVL